MIAPRIWRGAFFLPELSTKDTHMSDLSTPTSASPVLIVGSMALDSVRTPVGEVQDALGGAADYSGVAASFFSPVQLVGVVGGDFP